MRRAITPAELEEIYRIAEPHCAPGFIDQLRWEAAHGGVRRCFADDEPRPAATAEERVASIERSKAHKALVDACAPSRLRDLVVYGYGDRGEAYRESDIVLRLRRQLEAGDDRRIVLLYGEPGTGKSVAAAVALREQGGGAWVRAAEYAAIRMSKWRKPADERWLRRLESDCGCLVVDDVGEEDDEAAACKATLVDVRYDQRGTTIVTTNCSKAEFARRYKGRVISRLVAAGMALEATEQLRPTTRRDEA